MLLMQPDVLIVTAGPLFHANKTIHYTPDPTLNYKTIMIIESPYLKITQSMESSALSHSLYSFLYRFYF